MSANSKGPGKTALMHKLVWVFAGLPCDKYPFLYFCGYSLLSTDSRRAVVSFRRKNVHNTG